jgi:hypothetical protein
MDGRKIVIGAVLGGVAFGTFLGMTTPTAMAYRAEDDWRARLPTTHVATMVQPDQVAYNFGMPESVAPEFNVYHGIEAAERSRYLSFQREQDARFAALQSQAEAQVSRSVRESAQAEAAALRAEAARADAAAAAEVPQQAAVAPAEPAEPAQTEA